MLTRRAVLTMIPGAAFGASLTPRQRIDRVLAGQAPDRQPFSFWYHFGLEKEPPFRHAKATLDFHRKFRTDLVKVMSDFPYPKPSGGGNRLEVTRNPFPAQIEALRIIHDGLAGQAHFIETIFNPWNVAEKLTSKEEVRRLKQEAPQTLLDMLDVIATSEAHHARASIEAGASGVFLAIANAEDGILSRQDYGKFSEPFDRRVLEAVSSAPLNTLHLHGDKVYLDLFYTGWPAAAISYSTHGTGVAVAEVRKHFPGVLMCGLDERTFRSLSVAEMEKQWKSARAAAGARFLLAPGCSVPNDTADAELLRVRKLVGA